MARGKARYIGLDYSADDELDSSVAILQAAQALDVAAEYAVESRDTEVLLAVSMGWLKISEVLGEKDEEAEETETKPPISGVGFSGRKIDDDENN